MGRVSMEQVSNRRKHNKKMGKGGYEAYKSFAGQFRY
jgi:hypothetical protein